MNTQNTTMHLRLWTKEFWFMATANFLLCMSVTMLIPTLPQWLLHHEGLTPEQTGWCMAVFGAGLFLPGAFCSYLVQRYRRNMVYVWTVLLLALITLAPTYLNVSSQWSYMLVIRLLQGAVFGLALFVLTSTLIIDTSESFHRTEANHSAAWFGRFALSIGPFVGIIVARTTGFMWVLWACFACCLLSAALTLAVHFPFRVPTTRLRLFSTDRFFLTAGWPLFVFLFAFTFVIGLLLSQPLSEHFYAWLMSGFLLSLLAQRFVFPDAELKSEVVTGLLLTAGALLILWSQHSSPLVPPMLGFGIGMVGSRLLLFFVKLSHHCQRATSQSTFMLAWESGLAAGLGLGYGLALRPQELYGLSLAIVACCLAIYVLVLHSWFISHKNR